jgi:hypothetical protein
VKTKKILIVSALSLIAGLLFYQIPLVRELVWLNAAAISVGIHCRSTFSLIAVVEILLIVAGLWIGFWKLSWLWKEICHV